MNDPVSHIDIFPTILAATTAGGYNLNTLNEDTLSQSSLKHLVSNIDGVNLFPYIMAASNNKSSNSSSTSISTTTNTKLPSPHKSLYFRSGHYSAIRIGDWKLQVCGNPNKMWLYNLQNDPSEINNLISNSEYQEKLQEMLEELHEIERNQREPLWPSMTETAVHIDKLFEFNETLDDEYVYWPN